MNLAPQVVPISCSGLQQGRVLYFDLPDEFNVPISTFCDGRANRLIVPRIHFLHISEKIGTNGTKYSGDIGTAVSLAGALSSLPISYHFLLDFRHSESVCLLNRTLSLLQATSQPSATTFEAVIDPRRTMGDRPLRVLDSGKFR